MISPLPFAAQTAQMGWRHYIKQQGVGNNLPAEFHVWLNFDPTRKEKGHKNQHLGSPMMPSLVLHHTKIHS